MESCFPKIFYATNIILILCLVVILSVRFFTFPDAATSTSLNPALPYIRTPFRFNGPIPWGNLPSSIQKNYFDSISCENGEAGLITEWFDDGGSSANLGNIPKMLQPYVVWNKDVFIWIAKGIQKCIEKAKIKDLTISPYENTSNEFYRALESFPVDGKSVLVAGSISPWVECLVLAHGASKVTTSDWNIPSYDGDDIHFVHASKINSLQQGKFDAIFSFSSLEHDGLGRYGDPLDPNGDLKAMREMSRALRPGGLLFLGVPVGARDHIEFNVHRIYGPCRWKLMMDGWDIIGSFGADDITEKSVDWKSHFKGDSWANQPLFVMKKVHEPSHEFL